MSKKGGFAILRSHTLEQIGKFGLGKMPDVVDALQKSGKLHSSFKLPPGLSLAGELATTLGKHIGSGGADIDTITNYLDVMNKAAWTTVGYMVGGHEVAQVYQAIGDTAAKNLRKATLPLFEKGYLVWSGQGRKLVNDYRTTQQKRIHNGLSIQTISDVYGEKLLRKNGLGMKEIQGLDNWANNLNRHLIDMKKDLSVAKIENFKQSGELELGGVYIDPKLISAGKVKRDLKNKVTESRPSKETPFWSIEIPEQVE